MESGRRDTISDDGDSLSFDPRSWARHSPSALRSGKSTPTKQSSGEQLSLDPATWIGQAPAGEFPAREARQPRTATAAPASRILLAGIVAVLLIGAGAIAAYLARPHPDSKAAQPVVAAEQPREQAPRPPPPPEEPGHSRRTVTIGGPGELLQAMQNLGIDPVQSAALAEQVASSIGSAPGELRLTADLARSSDGQSSLTWLETTRADGAGVRLISDRGRIEAHKLAAKLVTKVVTVRGEMGATFYNSAVEAGLDDSLITDFAAAFSYDVDFQFELQQGDIFEGAFEQDYNPSGEPVGLPRLLFASLRLRDKSLRFYRFKAGDQYGWFDVNGRGNRRSLMRTPVDGARVSSGFGMRYHPVLHFTRMHKGTDFAAPIGTPVYASGNGRVIVAGCCHGDAGTMIAIQHDNGWITHYFHLNRIMPGILQGMRLTQGEKIGEVGMSGGHVTGPHLHYEVIIDGQPVDPLTIDTGQGITLSGAEMTAFRRERDRVDAARAAAGG